MVSTSGYDRAAAALSLSCIAHCVVLPLVAAGSAYFAALAETDWVHWTLTAFSVFVSVMVMARAKDAHRPSFLVPALCGIALLAAAAFAERFGVDETVPTLIGGILLAGAHISRLFKHS